MAKFKVGDKKPENSGRKPGTKNKKTEKLLELFEEYDYCPGESLIKLIQGEEAQNTFIPTELANIHLKLMEFKFPRRKAVEHTGANGSDLFETLLKKVDGSEEKPEEEDEAEE